MMQKKKNIIAPSSHPNYEKLINCPLRKELIFYSKILEKLVKVIVTLYSKANLI